MALVAAERDNRLIVLALPGAGVIDRIRVPADPENVAASAAYVVVVSARSGAVTLLRRPAMSRLALITGFSSPHIPAIAPGGRYVYVTDDGAGTVTAIRLADGRVMSRIPVGAGAHHMAFSPNGRRLWIALGESASRIVVLDTADLARPRVLGSFAPGFLVHDLVFAPGGDAVWVSSTDSDYVLALDAADHRVLFRVPVGAPPQHLVFVGPVAYLTSGYGGVIEEADAASGRVLARARSPYGSFELDADARYVVTSSLMTGTVALYDPQLRALAVRRVALAARDVALAPG